MYPDLTIILLLRYILSAGTAGKERMAIHYVSIEND
jgi:hypothetical protein